MWASAINSAIAAMCDRDQQDEKIIIARKYAHDFTRLFLVEIRNDRVIFSVGSEIEKIIFLSKSDRYGGKSARNNKLHRCTYPWLSDKKKIFL